MSYDIESALIAALNGAPLPKSPNATIRKNFSSPSYHRHKTTFVYSVQESWGGPRFKFEHSENTFIREDVKRKSEEAINHHGYINVVLLDIIQS